MAGLRKPAVPVSVEGEVLDLDAVDVLEAGDAVLGVVGEGAFVEEHGVLGMGALADDADPQAGTQRAAADVDRGAHRVDARGQAEFDLRIGRVVEEARVQVVAVEGPRVRGIPPAPIALGGGCEVMASGGLDWSGEGEGGDEQESHGHRRWTASARAAG